MRRVFFTLNVLHEGQPPHKNRLRYRFLLRVSPVQGSRIAAAPSAVLPYNSAADSTIQNEASNPRSSHNFLGAAAHSRSKAETLPIPRLLPESATQPCNSPRNWSTRPRSRESFQSARFFVEHADGFFCAVGHPRRFLSGRIPRAEMRLDSRGLRRRRPGPNKRPEFLRVPREISAPCGSPY